MKKKNNIFVKLFRPIGKLIDKILIRPVTKLVLKLRDWINSFVSLFDKMSNNKSFLLLVSLILAFSTFIIIDRERSVAMDQYAEIMYNQPVTAVYNDVQYVVEGLPETVDITLIGQKRHIFLAKQSPSKGVTVDLTGLKPGEHKVKLKYSQGLKSLEYKLDPSEVTITIYEKVSASKTLTYDILHSDELDSKLYINKVTLDRSEVIVKGSQKSLDKVASVRALIDVRDIPKDATGDVTLENVSLVAYDTNGKIIDVEVIPKTITAKLEITSPKKEVPIKVIPTGEVALGKSIKSIDTNINKVTVYGKSSAVNKLDALTVKVDVGELSSDKTFNITLEKPDGITYKVEIMKADGFDRYRIMNPYKEYLASADAAAQAIISCFADHNHYNQGTLAGDLMLKGYGSIEGIVKQLTRLLSNNTTAVTKVRAVGDGNNVVYTLHGQRLSAATSPGLYIINGHKVFVK